MIAAKITMTTTSIIMIATKINMIATKIVLAKCRPHLVLQGFKAT